MTSAVVVGASGGLGRAFVDAIIVRGDYDRIFALSRTTTDFGVPVVQLEADVTMESSLASAARAIGECGRIGLVIVATGMLHGASIQPEKALKALEQHSIAELLAVNAIGPALVAKHLCPLLDREGRAVFAAISARVGSIADNRMGGWYSYRASKAALNQIVKTLAVELGRTHPGAVAVTLHPGTVATALSHPFRPLGAGYGVFTPEESAGHLLNVIHRLNPDRSGELIDWTGSTIAF